MFEGWMFLVTEIWLLLLLAGLLGLFCGWIIWGSGKKNRALDPYDGALAGKSLPSLEPESLPEVSALPGRLNLEVSPDDLRRIRGIGPKIEAQCHQLGIYSYAQIAAWTAEDIAHIDVQLRGFEGRASRNDWVSEAKALMAESGQS
jgi:predicted flap endonuclease-1-like 5' DNA nuclease